MRVFLVVFFALSLFNAIVRAVKAMLESYPRMESFSLGEDCMRVLESTVIAAWAAYLLWG
jgi:hypothetical protein